MQRLLLGLELHDLVPEGGHLGLNAVDRLALFEDLGAERLLALAAATTASNPAIATRWEANPLNYDTWVYLATSLIYARGGLLP